MFGGEKWMMNALLTSFMCPSVLFAIYFLLNFILWMNSSSATIPIQTFLVLLLLWLPASTPLVFLGSYFGYKKPNSKSLFQINDEKRQIPNQPFTAKFICIIVGSIIPFGSVFIQLFFILNSIWVHEFFNMYGFLMITYFILMITSVEITVLICYCHLCAKV